MEDLNILPGQIFPINQPEGHEKYEAEVTCGHCGKIHKIKDFMFEKIILQDDIQIDDLKTICDCGYFSHNYKFKAKMYLKADHWRFCYASSQG